MVTYSTESFPCMLEEMQTVQSIIYSFWQALKSNKSSKIRHIDEYTMFQRMLLLRHMLVKKKKKMNILRYCLLRYLCELQ